MRLESGADSCGAAVAAIATRGINGFTGLGKVLRDTLRCTEPSRVIFNILEATLAGFAW